DAFIGLAQEYLTWMLAEIPKHYPELDIQAFVYEHAYDDIRQKFTGDDIRLLIAKNDEQFLACIALAKLSDSVCEMRSLYVRPAARGSGLGRKLAEASIAEAKALGYSKMRLDTLDFMKSALSLYNSLGFYEIEAYIELSPTLKQYIHFLE